MNEITRMFQAERLRALRIHILAAVGLFHIIQIAIEIAYALARG